jgi:hypothetical protein
LAKQHKNSTSMAKKDIIKHQFKQGESGNPKGRPKKLVSTVIADLKAEGYEEVTADHVKQAYQLLIGLDRIKVAEIGNDKEHSMLMVVVSRAILANKGFEIIEKMLDRAHGKATNKTEVTGAGGTPLIPFDLDKLTLDELRELERLTNKLEGGEGSDSAEVV